jgi:FMN phosphatase YigB (HAD superfamily)
LHFSFDAWNTLIKPNKEFSLIRTQILSENTGLGPATAAATYTEIKRLCDSTDMVAAEEHSTAKCRLLLERKVDAPINWALIDEAFLENPPIVLAQTVEAINKLRLRHTINVSSNTNFISGTIIQQVLERNGLVFDFYVFSDLVGVSKPNVKFFEHVEAEHHRRFGTWDRAFHFGDDERYDKPGQYMKQVIVTFNNLAEKIQEITNGKA